MDLLKIPTIDRDFRQLVPEPQGNQQAKGPNLLQASRCTGADIPIHLDRNVLYQPLESAGLCHRKIFRERDTYRH